MRRQRRPSLVNTNVPDEDIARLSIDTFFQTEFLVLQMRALHVLLASNVSRAFLGWWQSESLTCQAALMLPQALVLLLLTFFASTWSYFDNLAVFLALAECANHLLCLDLPLLPCILVVMLYPAIFRIRVQHIIAVSIAATLIVQVFSWGQMDLLHRVYWLLAVAFTWWMSSLEKNLVFQLCKERIRLEREERRSGSLLARMLPASTSYSLKEGEHHIASRHQSVTILFAKILHVTEYAQQMPAERLLALLNDVYFRFDHLMDQYRVFKIETVGEVYVASSGLPLACADHAARCARVAFAMVDAIKDFRGPDGKPLELKLGMHSGEIVSGVIGVLLPRYRLFGDTINTASRMCTNAPAPGQLTCSADTHNLLGGGFVIKPLEPRPIKGKGLMELFVVVTSIDDWSISRTESADSSVGGDVTDTIGYEVEVEVRGVASGRGKAIVFVAFQAIVLVHTDEYGVNPVNRSYSSLTPGSRENSMDDSQNIGSGGRVKMYSSFNSRSSPLSTTDRRSPKNSPRISSLVHEATTGSSSSSSIVSPGTPHTPAPPMSNIRERRRSIMQTLIPSVDKLKQALELLPMQLSDEKFGIPMDRVVQITHSMDRSTVELTLQPSQNSTEPLQIDLHFEGSWLKHEFVTSLTDAIGSDVVVDDLLLPANLLKRMVPSLPRITNLLNKSPHKPKQTTLRKIEPLCDVRHCNPKIEKPKTLTRCTELQ